MKDIHDVELQLGDRVLVAFSSSSYQNLAYAIITHILDEGWTLKVRFENPNFGKTKTIKGPWKYKMLKVDAGH
jgi:hypothetical protein